MSIGHCGFTGMGLPMNVPLPPVKNRPTPPAESRPLQRLAAVRRQQGVSRRTVARRLNIDIEQVQEQERETTDVPLSVCTLAKGAGGATGRVAGPRPARGWTLRSSSVRNCCGLMKTVRAICEQARQESIRRTGADDGRPTHQDHARTGLMSAPWYTVGKRRRLNELGIEPAALRGRGLYRQRRIHSARHIIGEDMPTLVVGMFFEIGTSAGCQMNHNRPAVEPTRQAQRPIGRRLQRLSVQRGFSNWPAAVDVSRNRPRRNRRFADSGGLSG